MERKEKSLFAALRNLGVDIDGTLSRFVDNTEYYEKFLRRYPTDGLMDPILKAFENKETETLLNVLHKMKGTSVNLGINNISDQCKDIASVIRSGEGIDVAPLIDKLKADYDEICDTIAKN